ncbi:MAG: zinc ribbon domain-containing protein [Ruminococcaceae bacterium]|nr:zinc ribbon domain-containing protein [Oscillospiraceae bacterium]
MFCKNCGQEVAENARFCASCGTAIPENNVSATIINKKRSPLNIVLIVFLCIFAFLGLLFLLDTIVLDGALFNKSNTAPLNANKNPTIVEDELSKLDTLKKYLKENGDLKGYKKAYSGDYVVYDISYNTDKNDIIFSYTELEGVTEENVYTYSRENIDSFTLIYLNGESSLSKVNWYYFFTDSSNYSASANIDKTIFSKSNDTLSNVDITGLISASHYDITKSLFVNDVLSTLACAKELLEGAGINVTLSDLGYTAFQ